MKFLFFSVTLVCLFSLISCEKEAVNTIQEDPASKLISLNTKERKRHIIYVAWDGNGRTRHNCTGFGMCNVVACVLCCTENGVIVPCEDGNSQTIHDIGEIVEVSGDKYFIFKLNPEDNQHAEAINNQSILYVDSDLTVTNTVYTLEQGAYSYDANIGEHGGYTVPVF